MKLSEASVLDKVARYYSCKLAQHGVTPRGVDWNGADSQKLRFQQLLRIVDVAAPFSLNDYGCGYGELATYLHEQDLPCAHYRGLDISENMIAAARNRFPGNEHWFTTQVADLAVADYTIASGIFNVRLDISTEEWTCYVLKTLDTLNDLSSLGFAFNLLTSYSDCDRMRPDLHYANPVVLFDHCKLHYSRRVALLHDYPLYEFTILVRKGWPGKVTESTAGVADRDAIEPMP